MSDMNRESATETQSAAPTVVDACAESIPESARTRCEVWTRVMGYHRPVASFNRGKQGEYSERVAFAEPVDVV